MISDKTLLRLTSSPKLVAAAGDLIRALVTAAVATTLALWLSLYAASARYMFNSLHMNDFGKFYYSAKAFLDGGDMYGPNVATAFPLVGGGVRQFWNMNPPHFHLLILPLARLNPLPALIIWAATNLLALVWSFRIIGRELEWRWTPQRLALTGLAVTVCSATGLVIVTGQLSFLLMLAMTMAWASARRGRWQLSAVALGIAVSIKPFLGLFWLYLLFTRRLKAATTMALVGATCGLLGLVVFGWAQHEAWLRALSQVAWTFVPMNASIHGVLARTLSDGTMLVPLAHAPTLVGPISTAMALTIGVGSLVFFARDKTPQATDRAFAGLLLTALLVSPLGWMYYVWLAAGPLAALWETHSSRPSRVRDACIVLAVPGLLAPLYVTLSLSNLPIGSITLGSIYAWTVCMMWGAVVTDRAQPPERSPA